MSIAFDLFTGERRQHRPPAPEIPENCNREGAQRLKEKIETYWLERGHVVMVTLENVGFHPAIRAARYEVRSDMRNALPRNFFVPKIPAADA